MAHQIKDPNHSQTWFVIGGDHPQTLSAGLKAPRGSWRTLLMSFAPHANDDGSVIMGKSLELDRMTEDDIDDGCCDQHDERRRVALRKHHAEAKAPNTTPTSSSASAAESDVVPTTRVVTYADLFRYNPRFNWFLLSYIVTNLGEYV
jgi:hypothetical protein